MLVLGDAVSLSHQRLQRILTQSKHRLPQLFAVSPRPHAFVRSFNYKNPHARFLMYTGFFQRLADKRRISCHASLCNGFLGFLIASFKTG